MALAQPPHAGPVAEAWARKLGTLRDHSLQVGWVRSEIERVGAARAADVLSIVLARAEQREERYATLLLRVSLALSTPLGAPLKGGIAAIAAARGQSSLARFLGHSERPEPGEEDPPENERDIPDFGKGRPLTL